MRQALIPALFDVLEGDLWSDFPTVCGGAARQSGGVSLYEDQEKVYVEVPMAGVSEDKISLVMEPGGYLEIRGEAHEDQKDKTYHLRAKRAYFYRIPIPAHVEDRETPEALYKDGILKVAFKKSQAARPLKIHVKRG